MVTPNRSENLDYDIQELIKEEWSDVNNSMIVDVVNSDDELPF
jgi:hypothetical protein